MQLRDAQTSALVFEGTPYAVAKLWKQSPDSYIFDDCYEGFDPHAEIARYDELADALKDAEKSRAKGVAELREGLKNTIDALDPGVADEPKE